ncbi:hypothetical protein PNOK_0187100 [Pyrrhoderma noxium]|uniref:Uncharacterized protein n=1 Tax=Pyrrhoderma noxium TaxID=2282107 RepID=A0A286UQW3_9AGAM|nr:hypothetical protein PNOK_0187100 [Pyrrhoderma noxium]
MTLPFERNFTSEDEYGTFKDRQAGSDKKGDPYANKEHETPGLNKNSYQYINKSRSVYRRNPDNSSDFVSSDRSIEFHRTLKGEKICSHSRSKIVTQNASLKLIKNKNPRFRGVRIIWVPMLFVMLVLLFFFFLWASSARKVYKSHCQPT